MASKMLFTASVVVVIVSTVFVGLANAASDWQLCPAYPGAKCGGRYIFCPGKECPSRLGAGGAKACYIDCENKCEATCKRRVANCDGYGALCYDPRFVGGDGVMFYFHGEKNKDFCIVSDEKLHINAHFIGKRPEGRARDFTWVQALGILSGDDNKLSIAANKVAEWDDEVDQLSITYNDEPVELPAKFLSNWTSPNGVIHLERTTDTNNVYLVIKDIMALSVRVRPISKRENQVHNYQISSDDCFAHLDLQFKFFKLTHSVDGVLGQTYRPDFESPVKRGVAMPVMGGDNKYFSSSLFATDCSASKYLLSATEPVVTTLLTSTRCSTAVGAGIVCRR